MERTWTWIRTLRRLLSRAMRTRTGGTERERPRARRAVPTSGPTTRPGRRYPGDFRGVARVEYRPRTDHRADPGEVVWGWVPFEEDHSRGKDRPALVVGRDGAWVLALMLSSRDHDADPSRHAERWMDVGSGAWDPRGRPSEVRLDRVLRLDPDGIRRRGATLDRATFDRVAAELRRRHGWH